MSKIEEAFHAKGRKLFESEEADVEAFNIKYANLPELISEDAQSFWTDTIKVRVVDINNNVIVMEMCKAYARTFAQELLERTL